MFVWLAREVLYGAHLSSRPPSLVHLFIDRSRAEQSAKGFFLFSWAYRGRETIWCRATPHSVLSPKWPSVVCDGTVYGEAMEGAIREVHRGVILVEA
jgi:hypothetical protein